MKAQNKKPVKTNEQSSIVRQTSAPVGVSPNTGIAEPVALETPTGTLRGTLQLPSATKAPFPIALIIAGSGPTDRDGNTPLLPGANNSLKDSPQTVLLPRVMTSAASRQAP